MFRINERQFYYINSRYGCSWVNFSSVEMASKGELGIELELDKIPCREENMTPYEMMLSESQERMVIILEDEKRNTQKKYLINGI